MPSVWEAFFCWAIPSPTLFQHLGSGYPLQSFFPAARNHYKKKKDFRYYPYCGMRRNNCISFINGRSLVSCLPTGRLFSCFFINKMKTIFTIGHSNHTFEKLLELLKAFDIEILVDLRRYPGSRKYPHFNKDSLQKTLPENGIQYQHFEDLGGRRKAKPDSHNTAWRLDSFKGYADYMETDEFTKAIQKLEKLATEKTACYMCSEAVWWSCHRSLISDYLKNEGWNVQHIMNKSKSEEHPYTKPAKIIGGKLDYTH